MTRSTSQFGSGSGSRSRSSTFVSLTLFVFGVPLLLAIAVYQLDRFDPAAIPIHEFGPVSVTAPLTDNQMLRSTEFVGVGKLQAPEDIAYHSESGLIYTGCKDGWIKRVAVNETVGDSVVEDWVNTGGRPLGLAFGHYQEVIVADAYKGLLNISSGGEVELLTDEADGLKFNLTDAVVIADNGVIYFTDASYKYNLKNYIYDILEGRPYGRLMSFDPIAKQTKVLLADLYFANGVTISPDQTFVIFCETPMRRCRRYYIEGDKKGSVENFVKDLPGVPDNIRYDGEGRYWIALATNVTPLVDLVLRYPFIRKVVALLVKYNLRPDLEENGGVIAVDLEGIPLCHYYDKSLSHISSGLKIGKNLYVGSLRYSYIMRVNLNISDSA